MSLVHRLLKLDRHGMARKLGRRGLLLILSGLAWVAAGFSLLTERNERFSSPGEGTDRVLQFLDGPLFAFLWILCGVVAFACGLFRDRRFFAKYDSLGFNAILVPAMLWGLFFLWSWAANLATDGREGRATGITGALVYALVCLFILVVAGWPEPRAETVLKNNDGVPPRPTGGDHVE